MLSRWVEKASFSISSQHDQNSIPANLYIMYLFFKHPGGLSIGASEQFRKGAWSMQVFQAASALKIVNNCYAGTMAEP